MHTHTKEPIRIPPQNDLFGHVSQYSKKGTTSKHETTSCDFTERCKQQQTSNQFEQKDVMF